MKRYQIIPAVLAIYAIVMAYMGRAKFFNPDTRLTYLLTILGEAAVLIALYFFLRRRERMRQKRDR